MLDYKKILFPVDLSETSVKISPHVEAIAEKFGAEVRLLYVAEVNEYYVEGEEPGVSVKKKVVEYKNKHFKNIPDSQVSVADGDPAEEILSYVEVEGIDMVIMATKGRSALDKAIFGSVAANVARAAPIPVFLINPFRDKFIS